jgi:hypothetical protein
MRGVRGGGRGRRGPTADAVAAATAGGGAWEVAAGAGAEERAEDCSSLWLLLRAVYTDHQILTSVRMCMVVKYPMVKSVAMINWLVQGPGAL